MLGGGSGPLRVRCFASCDTIKGTGTSSPKTARKRLTTSGVRKTDSAKEIMSYLWVTLGSAIGGLLRFAITRLTLPISAGIPFGTILINVLGSFVIGYFGTLTLVGSRFAATENLRLFVMVGLCGGFTTFSSFSLQTFDLLRSGAWGRALANIALSVLLCLGSVAAGHLLAQRSVDRTAVVQTAEEEFTG